MYFSLKYFNVMSLLEILVYTYFTICFTLFENMFLYHIFDSTLYFFRKAFSKPIAQSYFVAMILFCQCIIR